MENPGNPLHLKSFSNLLGFHLENNSLLINTLMDRKMPLLLTFTQLLRI